MPITDERIRDLCKQALSAADDDALNRVIPELRDALAEHVRQTRAMAASKIQQAFPPEKPCS